ncbi:hypothetical protein [Saccharomonospora xinjiangensis]|uniref:Uncharacterized protein n=1 Tax=Saccharomonospora xinjiangensis XJ-54 TaxID=882086 RepID=I0V2Z5_9PSEU|nr:hypothetical protein [Saccharomonospora xinjiangensis]EID54498.1 hypothetical protein SacxiDRAFT_2268 [Saccharomonospora xinjiangensis XJ-54]
MTSPSDLRFAETVSPETAEDAEAVEAAEAAEVENALGRLIERGFKFVHPRNADGEIVTIVGVRVHGTVIDVVRLDAEDEVTAMRMPAEESDILAPSTLLWRRDGALREVIDALLDLPDATEPQAQRRGGLGRGCWVRGNHGRAKYLRVTA